MGRSDRLKGYFFVLASALFYGAYGAFVRLIGPEFGIFYQAWVRAVITLVLLLPFAIIGKHFKPIRKEDRKWFAAILIISIFTQAPIYFAFNHLPLGTATFIFYGLFLITSYVTGWLFLKEKITPIKKLSLLLAFLGLFLTFSLSLSSFSWVAMLLAAFNGVASGSEIALTKKIPRYSSLQIVYYSWLCLFLTHLPLSLWMGEHQYPFAFNGEWLAMFGYVAAGIGGFWFVIEGFKYVDASIGGLIGLLEILFSAFLGVVFFHDHLTLSVLFGGLIIILAAVLPDVYALKNRKEKPAPPPQLL
jgi:drug/metabolite transporter (DMT)-like permease